MRAKTVMKSSNRLNGSLIGSKPRMSQPGKTTMHGCLAAGVITLLVAVLQPANADEVPILDVDQVCRGIAQHAAAPGKRAGPIYPWRNAFRANSQSAKGW
jgi:hypothetical protein